jgi:hypothetical protein
MALVEYNIDASTFQEPLVKLAEVLAQKVKREAPNLLRAPLYISIDLFVLMRQAMYTYNLLFYLNADERRDKAGSSARSRFRYARVMGMKEDAVRSIGFKRLAIVRPCIIIGNAHTPAWTGWLGSLLPGPFGKIDQRILGRFHRRRDRVPRSRGR